MPPTVHALQGHRTHLPCWPTRAVLYTLSRHHQDQTPSWFLLAPRATYCTCPEPPGASTLLANSCRPLHSVQTTSRSDTYLAPFSTLRHLLYMPWATGRIYPAGQLVQSFTLCPDDIKIRHLLGSS